MHSFQFQSIDYKTAGSWTESGGKPRILQDTRACWESDFVMVRTRLTAYATMQSSISTPSRPIVNETDKRAD